MVCVRPAASTLVLAAAPRDGFRNRYRSQVNPWHCAALGGEVLLPVFASQRMTLSSLEQNWRTPDWL